MHVQILQDLIFLGHCVEMAEASNVTFELNVHDIAYLDEAISYAKMEPCSGGAYKNKGYSYQKVDFRNVEDHLSICYMIRQTSGGLLISVEAQYAGSRDGSIREEETGYQGIP